MAFFHCKTATCWAVSCELRNKESETERWMNEIVFYEFLFLSLSACVLDVHKQTTNWCDDGYKRMPCMSAFVCMCTRMECKCSMHESNLFIALFPSIYLISFHILWCFRMRKLFSLLFSSLHTAVPIHFVPYLYQNHICKQFEIKRMKKKKEKK